MVLPGSEQDNATENHIDGCSHKCWSEENQCILDDIWSNIPAALVFECIQDSSDVSNRFAYIEKPTLV